jgi:hypothetical protein
MKLAWNLAEACTKRFRSSDRAAVYAELGAGETYVAIRHMLAIAVHERHSLPAKLVTALAAWLDGYIGNEHEPAIRWLLNTIDRHTQLHGSTGERRRRDARAGASKVRVVPPHRRGTLEAAAKSGRPASGRSGGGRVSPAQS